MRARLKIATTHRCRKHVDRTDPSSQFEILCRSRNRGVRVGSRFHQRTYLLRRITRFRTTLVLRKKAEESKEAVNLDTLDSLVKNQLRMDMSDKNASSGMESLFLSYQKLLRRHGLAWLLKANQKVAVYHLLPAIKPSQLQNRLDADLDFAYHEYRKDFPKFMEHCIRLSEAFQILDNGPGKKREESRNQKPKRGGNNDKSPKTDFGNKPKQGGQSKRQAPPCPHPPCKAQEDRHWIRDCRKSTDEQKSTYLADIAASKSRDGPSLSTRSHTSDKKSESTDTSKGRPTAGRMTDPPLGQKKSEDSKRHHVPYWFQMAVHPFPLPDAATTVVTTVSSLPLSLRELPSEASEKFERSNRCTFRLP